MILDMRLARTAHTSQPWRIHAIAGDFRVEDVWALPTPGARDDFSRLVLLTLALDPGDSASCAIRSLFALRWQIGRLLGWDRPDDGLGARVPSLRDRLPPDLRGTAAEMEFAGLPFSPLYLTDTEFAAEIANRTMHGILHLGWVPHGDGYRGQMAVLVRRNGLLGTAYMAAIAPFRHRIVYPPAIRELGRVWRSGLAFAA
jgi:hypothetical protein